MKKLFDIIKGRLLLLLALLLSIKMAFMMWKAINYDKVTMVFSGLKR